MIDNDWMEFSSKNSDFCAEHNLDHNWGEWSDLAEVLILEEDEDGEGAFVSKYYVWS